MEYSHHQSSPLTIYLCFISFITSSKLFFPSFLSKRIKFSFYESDEMKLNENYFLNGTCVVMLEGVNLITSLISLFHNSLRAFVMGVEKTPQPPHKLQSINLLQPCLTSSNFVTEFPLSLISFSFVFL